MKDLPQDVREALQEVFAHIDKLVAREEWSTRDYLAGFGIIDGRMESPPKSGGYLEKHMSGKERQEVEDGLAQRIGKLLEIKGHIDYIFRSRKFQRIEPRDCDGQLYFEFFDKRDLYPKVSPF